MNEDIGIVALLLSYILVLWIALAATTQRLHDLEKSGWLGILIFIPLVNIFMMIYLYCFAGLIGGNQYGAEPPANTVWNKIGACLLPLTFILGIVAAVAIPAYSDYVKAAGG